MKRKMKETDFDYGDLPSNRFQVFFDVLKLRWKTFFLLGFFLLLGFLPLLAVIFIRDNYVLSLSYRVAREEMTAVDANSLNLKAHFTAACISSVCLFIAALPICGAIRVIRQMVWGEPLFFKEDFLLGIKTLYKHACIVCVFIAAILILDAFMPFISDNSILCALAFVLFLAFIVPPLLFAIFQSSIYQGSFFQFYKNGILFYIKEFPKAVLFNLLLLCPCFLGFMTSFLVVKYILLLVLIFAFLPYAIMANSLFYNSVFDRYINETNYPELVHKGFVPKEDKK